MILRGRIRNWVKLMNRQPVRKEILKRRPRIFWLKLDGDLDGIGMPCIARLSAIRSVSSRRRYCRSPRCYYTRNTSARLFVYESRAEKY